MAKVDSKLVNKSSNILLDFSPVVVPVYSQESSSFMLLPSLKAAVVLNPGLQMKPLLVQGSQHARYPLPQYGDLFDSGNANMTVENVSLHSHDNYTSLSMALLNNGKSNVTVMAVLVYGNETPSGMHNTMVINGTAIVNASDIWDGQHGVPSGADWSGASRLFQRNDSDFSLNESAIREAGAYLGVNSVLIRMPGRLGNVLIRDINGYSVSHASYSSAYMINDGMMPMLPPGMDFLVNGNGTLFMPSPQTMMAQVPKPGYLLMQRSSATLSYNGTIRIMEGGLSLTLPSGSSYRIMVITSEGITQANVTSN